MEPERKRKRPNFGNGPIFGPDASLFFGRSPTDGGMLPPHASHPAQISGRAIRAYL